MLKQEIVMQSLLMIPEKSNDDPFEAFIEDPEFESEYDDEEEFLLDEEEWEFDF